jgi:uncharacterized protein YjiS (DUF1127 family)
MVVAARDLHIAEYRSIQRPLSVVLRVLVDCGHWLTRMRQRRALLHMDAYMRRDLGLSEADVWLEVSKHPWQS